MATARQVTELIRSYVEGSESRFRAIALQIAASEAQSGHTTVADQIRSYLDQPAKPHRPELVTGAIPLALPRGEMSAILSYSEPKIRLNELVLEDELERNLTRVVVEQRNRRKLEAKGLLPRAKLLLVGPPGTGKTMSASAMASELHLPLFTVMLHALIGKFMGETAAKLALVFEHISRHPGVYFFDEFDAIGVDRGIGNDVGEIRRVLNSLLQFIEKERSESVIVAATNHPTLLDKALFRRFDDVLHFHLPTSVLAIDLAKRTLLGYNTQSVDWRIFGNEVEGLSYADIQRICEDAAKHATLRDSAEIPNDDLLDLAKQFKRGGLHDRP